MTEPLDPTERLLREEHPPVFESFLRVAATQPDRVAIEAGGMSLTYGQLAGWSSDLARLLRSNGIRPNMRVAVIGRRSPGSVASLLAVLAVGGVMVPVDEALPVERQKTIVEEARVDLIVSVAGAGGGWMNRAAVEVPTWPSWEPSAGVVGGVDRSFDDPAYIFFTSGSTGIPKGVLGTHGSLAQFMAWMASTFDIGADDRVALARSLSFDAVLREVFVPLTVGGRIVIAPDPFDPDAALQWLASNRISVLHGTPSHCEVWLDGAKPSDTSLRWVFFSGELLRPRLAETWRKVMSPPGRLVNLYGPTETTFIRTFHVVEDPVDDEHVPVGFPLPGTQLLVLDDENALCPPGVPGEVVIRTCYGTLGYVNADGSDRFVPNPFSGDPGDVVYRTGDVGWTMESGELVVSGRLDDQVKILGVRIEPGEVAALLEQHPGVQRAVILAVDRDGRTVSLAGFLVPDGRPPSAADLRDHLAERLPRVAIPSTFHFIDRFPLMPNGKVDRRALEAMRTEPAGRSPASPSLLRAVASPVGRSETVGDRIARLSPEKRALLQARLGGNASPSSVSDRIARLSPEKRALLAARLGGGRTSSDPQMIDRRAGAGSDRSSGLATRSPVERQAPLSSAQERLWFLDKLHPGRSNYNISRSHRLLGRLDIEALGRACDSVVARHEILRTRYTDVDGEPMQLIDPPGPAWFRVIDLEGIPAAESHLEVERLVAEESSHSFDLETEPVWRVTVLRMSDVEHIMVTVLHHIAGDGWSLPILYEDLSRAYAKAVAGESECLEALPIQYADYAIRQRDIINRGGYAADLEFWTEQLEGAPDIIPLPTDRPRPAVLTSRGHRVRFTLRSAPTAAFWRIAKEETASGFMVGMAIYQAFLQHVTGVDDLVVGMPSADRSDADTQPLVGFLVNTLALRARVEPGLSLREWVRTVRRAALDAYDHREVPFEHVVRHLAPSRRTDRNPLFQLFYQFGTGAFAARPDLVGIDAEPVERITTSSKFDITLYLGHDDHTLTGSMVYNADLFDEPTIADLIHRLDEFAGRALAHPDEPIEFEQRTVSQRTVSRGPIEPERRASSEPAQHVIEGICRIWSGLLGADVGPDDDFFALGGHSLLAIRMLSRAESELGISLPIRALFEDSTPRRLAARVQADAPTSTSAPVEALPQAPLSFAQRRLWFLHRLDPEAGNYHTPWRVRLRGRLSMSAVQSAFDLLVERHAVFRTRIVDEGGIPMQVVDSPRPLEIDIVDATDSRVEQVSELVGEAARAPFDLATEWMLRVTVYRMGEEDHLLSVVAHHIATDGESMSILRREFTECYRAHVEGRSPRLPPLKTSYREMAAQQVARFSSSGEPHLRWWLDRLAGELPVLDLPSDRVRPLRAPRHGAVATDRFEGEALADLLRLAERERVTPFMAVLTAAAVLLHRYSRQEDLIIGIPSTERDSMDLEGVIGFFVNSLPIRIGVEADVTFRDLLRQVRRSVLDALEHKEVPFEAMVERLDLVRDPSRQPVFQVMVDMNQPSGGRFSLPDLETVPTGLGPSRRPAKFDLRIHASLRDGSLRHLFEYRSDLFDAGTATDMSLQFTQLLASIAVDPDVPITRLDMNPPQRRPEQMPLESPSGSVVESFDAAVQRYEARLAVVDRDGGVRYGDLARASHRVAACLAEAGVRPGDTVGLRMGRGPALVTAMLGVLRAGAAYVPLDESYPSERVEMIVADAHLSCILTEGPDIASPSLEQRPSPESPPLDPALNPAYVMYTSGSTGRPKGVVVPDRGILRLVIDPDYAPIRDDDVIAFASNTGFDAVTFEVWGALLNGATLAVLDRETMLDPGALANELESLGVTVMFVTTALFNTVVAQRPDAFSSLGTLMFGGEAVDPDAVRRCLIGGPPERLVHVYGPTETTTFATWHLVTNVPDDAITVPIGRPINGTSVAVVDDHLEDVPHGVPGELIIGGPGVALGYLDDPELTAVKFDRGRYRTGDLVRRRHDGDIEFLGRLDRQIKLRGFRIEPGEIEAHLTALPDVEAAVVIPHRDQAGTRLVAYVVSSADATQILDRLRSRIPRFMVPAALMHLPALPMTPNGKVDVDALPEPVLPSAPYRAPEGDTETRLAALWASVLGVERVGRDDDFFELGGHSLLAIQLFAAIKDEFGISAPLSVLFEAPTLVDLASRIIDPVPDQEPPPVVTIRSGAAGPPLFCMPPAGGNVMVYEPMARAFAGERSVLGVQARGVDGVASPLRTIEEMAAYCEEAILAVEPEGPYLLAGYSMGGLVAFETARRMEAAGRQVDLVVLIDAMLMHDLGARRRLRADLRVLRRRGFDGAKWVARRWALRARRLAGRVRHDPKLWWYRIRRRPLSPLLAGRRLTAAGLEASMNYRPGPYRGRVLYLAGSALSVRGRQRAVAPWESATDGAFELIEVPGTHKGPGSVMHDPNAQSVVEAIRAVVEREQEAT